MAWSSGGAPLEVTDEKRMHHDTRRTTEVCTYRKVIRATWHFPVQRLAGSTGKSRPLATSVRFGRDVRQKSPRAQTHPPRSRCPRATMPKVPGRSWRKRVWRSACRRCRAVASRWTDQYRARLALELA